MKTVMIEDSREANFTGVVQSGKRFEAYFEGTFLGQAYIHRSAEIMVEKKTGTFQDRRKKSQELEGPQEEITFHINERFDFLEKSVLMVASEVQPSIIISGSGGLGKTYTVRNTLEGCGFGDASEDSLNLNPYNSFVFIKGFSTAKNLYRTLYNHNGCIIVLDDIDNILRDPVAINLLKACLDSYDKRVVSWGAESKGDDNLPKSFEFTGRIIFITNIPSEKIDQAIRSRSLVVDVSMTREEMVDRMWVIARSNKFLPDYSWEVKEDSLEFIRTLQDQAKELSLRSLITICNIRNEFPNDWKNMATYVLVGN